MPVKDQSELIKKFGELTKLKYADQAKWILNGFWNEIGKEAENIWKYTNKFIEIDPRKKEGNELNEFEAHQFLESLGETLTVVAMRDRLRKIDLDFNGKVALIEYLTVRFNKDVVAVVNAPQGDPEEVRKASAKLEAVQVALAEVTRQLEEQQRVLDTQKAAEEVVRKAEAELKAAVDELKQQEDSYNNQIKALETKSKDPNLGAVSKNKAAAELAQLKSEDPLPLRRSKITAEAKLKPVEKARKEAEAATAVVAEQTRKVEAAVRETEEKVKEAEAYLEHAKSQGESPGAIWWLERELKEAQKYLPKSKQTKQ